MAIGPLKRFNATRGCGFIAPQRGGREVFVRTAVVQKGRAEPSATRRCATI